MTQRLSQLAAAASSQSAIEPFFLSFLFDFRRVETVDWQ